jgi:hypothetical protein
MLNAVLSRRQLEGFDGQNQAEPAGVRLAGRVGQRISSSPSYLYVAYVTHLTYLAVAPSTAERGSDMRTRRAFHATRSRR